MDGVMTAFQGGLDSLASYLAAHVLLCLVPAFFIAGALSALVPQPSIIRFLGPDAPKWKSYSAAAGAGSLLAVCSCTIQPLFAGIYRKGAGLGPAVTFLFSPLPPIFWPWPIPESPWAPSSPSPASCWRSPSASASA